MDGCLEYYRRMRCIKGCNRSCGRGNSSSGGCSSICSSTDSCWSTGGIHDI